jgi:hypothetical protein
MTMDSVADTTMMRFLLANTDFMFDETDYPVLEKHIEVHKYFINRTIPWTVSWDEAAFSWIENVHGPIMQVMDLWNVRHAFPRQSRAHLFFAISDHWYHLLNNNPRTEAAYAAIDYAARYGRGLGKYVSKLVLGKQAA